MSSPSNEKKEEKFSPEFLAIFKEYCVCEATGEMPSKEILIGLIKGCLVRFTTDDRKDCYKLTEAFLDNLQNQPKGLLSKFFGSSVPENAKIIEEAQTNAFSGKFVKNDAALIILNCLRYSIGTIVERSVVAESSINPMWDNLKKRMTASMVMSDQEAPVKTEMVRLTFI